jgi:PPM family protein phosphatase
MLCSDGLSDVVTEQTLHKTLVTFTDPDDAVIQLIELAIRGGGPDNITCIVADVVDTTTDPAAPSQASVIVGAASNSDGGHPVRTDSPAGRAHQLTHVSPLPAAAADFGDAQRPAVLDDDDFPEDDEDDVDDGRWARRWPVVTSILVVLLLLIAGGGYAAWRYTQGQYYVGASGGQVAIFRGVNERVAGMSLSSVYARTGIPMSGVPANDARQVETTITAAGLADARRIVLNIRHGYLCQQAFTSVQKWAAGKPKPRKVKKKVHGKTVVHTIVPHYRPKPSVPGYCPQQGASG